MKKHSSDLNFFSDSDSALSLNVSFILVEVSRRQQQQRPAQVRRR